MFAFLLVALIAIISFRTANLAELEASASYRIEFTVWRGASYLIWFNWVCAVVFCILDHLGINYRMILMENGFFIEKYQSFIWTASFLSAIYLGLFLVYMLNSLNYITNQPWLSNLGYYMWIINVVFMLNPLKVFNYHSRMWFIYMLWRFVKTVVAPMNMSIFFISIILASCAQPVNDMAFTLCSLRYNDETICTEQGRLATFIYMLVFLFLRAVDSVRLHRQFGGGLWISRANQGLTAVLFTSNTITASYLYGTRGTDSMLVYFIISAIFSTMAGINADYRADWGILSLDEEDCLLRRFRYFNRKTYLFWAIVDAILNVAWVLTISNNIRAFLNINVLYFFMLLQYI
jgi:hypothetical protein